MRHSNWQAYSGAPPMHGDWFLQNEADRESKLAASAGWRTQAYEIIARCQVWRQLQPRPVE
jgi:hypothetical protein